MASFADPKENVQQMGLTSSMKVADLGAGSGHYAVAAARIADEGKVYAIDVQEDVLTRLKRDVEQAGITNVEAIWGNVEKVGGTKLRDGAMDAAILSNTLFQLEDREGMLAEIKRILKPGGKLLVVDWAGAYEGMGPSPEQVVSERAAEELFVGGGFHKVKALRGGPHHYAILFEMSS